MDKTHHKYIERTFYLAKKGLGNVKQNPMVGCVIVKDNKIIGEGYHKKYGKEHAEVNAIKSVTNKKEIKGSSIYVNLEPCSHYGKTPPCTLEIIKHKPKEVIIANKDPNKKVNGRGIDSLRENGINVIEGIKRKEGENLNKRFFTNQNKKRPYIILKWAQTIDGFIARKNGNSKWISNGLSRKFVHKWRSDEDGICVGINTVLIDNPKLNVRKWKGDNPLRIIINPKLKSLKNKKVINDELLSLIINQVESSSCSGKEFYKTENLSFKKVLDILYKKGISSLLVEGGAKTLNNIIEENIWDEARVFTGNNKFDEGIKAPSFKLPKHFQDIDKDKLYTIYNNGRN
tara:strand:+ start:4747 stop:5778 length:1032 start_codon:yes stop_codon:yes gene_type:complete